MSQRNMLSKAIHIMEQVKEIERSTWWPCLERDFMVLLRMTEEEMHSEGEFAAEVYWNNENSGGTVST